MLKQSIIKFIAPILMFTVLFVACTKEESSINPTVFNLRMTDAPLDNVQEVNIDLQRIIVKTDDGRDSFDLGTNAGIYNLLDYQGDLDTLIGSTTLNAASLKEIRLVLGEENTIMVDSVLHDLKTPSAQQSGLKIKINKDLSDLDIYNVLIDFDAEASVVEQGNGNFLLKPVIRVVQ